MGKGDAVRGGCGEVGNGGRKSEARGNEAEVDIPEEAAGAEEDDAALGGDVGGAEEVCNGPDFVRVPDDGPHLLDTIVNKLPI